MKYPFSVFCSSADRKANGLILKEHTDQIYNFCYKVIVSHFEYNHLLNVFVYYQKMK